MERPERKSRHVSRVAKKEHRTGVQVLFDVLSEARGFGHLRSIDCTAVHFIKRTDGKTPDLGAVRGGGEVLCEVKTINISQDEAEKRQRITQGAIVASSTSFHEGEGFLRKLSSTLEQALEQLDGLDPERETRRLVFVVVHLDDWVGDYQPEYFTQNDEHLLRSPIEGAELVCCQASKLFQHTLTLRSATLLSE